jgi:hypothetical protein
MKKLVVLLFVVVTLFVSGCNTPYKKALVYINASSHFQGVTIATYESSASRQCPDWAEFDSKDKCFWFSQSYDNPVGTTQNPLEVPIKTFEVGRVQLNGAYMLSSWGLGWTDQDGNPVTIDEMEEGVFYTFHRTGSPAGFQLANP